MNINWQAKTRLQQRYSKCYPEIDYFDKAIADELFERLHIIKMQPEVILNYCYRNDHTSQRLRERFAHAVVMSMLDIRQLANQSVDCIFSNLVLHDDNDIYQTLLEFRRILKPNGLLFFSMLGRDTLKELRACFQEVSQSPHIHDYFDMHDIGDVLLEAQFIDPVMDMEDVVIHFSSVEALVRDIKKAGLSNVHKDRSRGLMGKNRWKKMVQSYQRFIVDEKLPATFEVIYGHAWVSDQPMHAFENEAGETVFPLHLLTLK